MRDSDHVNCGGGYGPSWVSRARQYGRREQVLGFDGDLRAVGRLGRLYDHVAAAVRITTASASACRCLVISPYAKQDYVSHAQYETASVLRFAEDLYGLGQLAAADKRATSPAAGLLRLLAEPRRFEHIRAPHGADFFMRNLPPDYFAPDYE